jgi:hypothetical protein
VPVSPREPDQFARPILNLLRIDDRRVGRGTVLTR